MTAVPGDLVQAALRVGRGLGKDVEFHVYDGADNRPLAGVGSTEAEAIADLHERLEDLLCPECKSGPGEPHGLHCSLGHD